MPDSENRDLLLKVVEKLAALEAQGASFDGNIERRVTGIETRMVAVEEKMAELLLIAGIKQQVDKHEDRLNTIDKTLIKYGTLATVAATVGASVGSGLLNWAFKALGG